MKRKKRVLIATLIKKQSKYGMYMVGTLEGKKIPVKLSKSQNKRGEEVWDLFIDG